MRTTTNPVLPHTPTEDEMSITQRISRTTSYEEYLDRAVLDELSNGAELTPGEIADVIGGVPVNREREGSWMGSWDIDGRAVSASLKRLAKRNLVRKLGDGRWEITRTGFDNGYYNHAMLAEKGIKITGVRSFQSGETAYRVERDGKTIGYVRRLKQPKPTGRRRRGGPIVTRGFVAYGMTTRGEIKARPEPGPPYGSTTAAAARLGGLS